MVLVLSEVACLALLNMCSFFPQSLLNLKILCRNTQTMEQYLNMADVPPLILFSPPPTPLMQQSAIEPYVAVSVL